MFLKGDLYKYSFALVTFVVRVRVIIAFLKEVDRLLFKPYSFIRYFLVNVKICITPVTFQ